MAYPKVTLRKIPRKKGHVYQIDYSINDKRHREIVSKTKREGEAIAGQLQADLALGKFDLVAEKKPKIDINSLIQEYISNLRNTVRPSTIHRYINHLERFKIFIQTNFPRAADDISLIKQVYIKECMNDALESDKMKNWAPATANRMLQAISSLYNYAIQQEYLEKNPTKYIKNIPIPESDKPEFFTTAELESIWKAVAPFWKPFLQFLYYTGLRKGELINLTWPNVFLSIEKPEIRIVSSAEWTTKTGKSRIIKLHKKALLILKQQKGINEQYVFVTQNGKKIHPDRPYHAMKKALKKLDLHGDVHKIRHSFASHHVMNGTKIFTLQKFLGHADIKHTMIYTHLSPDYEQSEMDNLK